ncbi:kinectin-like isoform X4 [Centruroides vittatus]|uniref:kinectin-like isoform X4 n=1 Tax=Centruroides vittatus TaxID=120091 RepID=UPI00350EA555
MTIQMYSLPQMVDLALSPPIIGVVNFGILRTILHILIKEMGLENIRSKLNVKDMKPQKIEMPVSPRQPSSIAQSVEDELRKIELDDEVPNAENISGSSPSIREEFEAEEVYSKLSEDHNSSFEEEEEIFDEVVNDIGEEEDELLISKENSMRSVASNESSFKGPSAFQEDMTEFWKMTVINSRVTALEGGLEKIVDIIDEQARDLEHFRRDTERRRAKDSCYMKDLQINLEELKEKTNNIIHKVEACVSEDVLQRIMKDHEKYTTVTNIRLEEFEEQLLQFSEKVEGDFKMLEIVDDINDIREILKIPRRKTATNILEEEEDLQAADIQQNFEMSDMLQDIKGRIEFDSSQSKDIQYRVEDIRNCKVDRSEMLDGLDRKADKSQLEEKLDKSTHVASCEEINLQFVNVIAKIAAQEQETERNFQKIKTLLDQKLEISEMDKHREILKERLKIIVTKLKLLRDGEEEHSAAGVKVRCISCDRPLKQFNKNVVISDGSQNPQLQFEMPHNSEGFLPPVNEGNLSEGYHKLKTQSFYLKKTAITGPDGNKAWEEVPLQGTDGRIYRGYLKKTRQISSSQ